jgi:hypothetical protein
MDMARLERNEREKADVTDHNMFGDDDMK